MHVRVRMILRHTVQNGVGIATHRGCDRSVLVGPPPPPGEPWAPPSGRVATWSGRILINVVHDVVTSMCCLGNLLTRCERE